MKNLDLRLEDLIQDETTKIQKKKPFVENIEISYEHNNKGIFSSKLKAHTRNRTINLVQKNRCAESAIRKLFTTLQRQLSKRTYVKPRRFNLSLKEAA